MPGRLAVDFGTSNTVVPVWDEALQEGVPLHVPDYGQLYQQGNEKISVIPSQIHYGADRPVVDRLSNSAAEPNAK